MPLVSEKTPRWRNVIGLVLLAATFFVVMLVFVQGNNTNDAVSATKDSVERTDCARRVNAEQSQARDAATLADRAVSRYYYKAVLDATVSGDPVNDGQIQTFAALVTAADAADQVVKDLPDPASEVERRCPG